MKLRVVLGGVIIARTTTLAVALPVLSVCSCVSGKVAVVGDAW